MLLTCVTKALLRATGIISEDRETKLETHFDVDLLTTNVEGFQKFLLQTDIHFVRKLYNRI